MICFPKRAHSPTASSTIEVLALAVGGGASGFHDETGQGPSGGSPAALLGWGWGLGAGAQPAASRTRTRIMRRIAQSTSVVYQRPMPPITRVGTPSVWFFTVKTWLPGRLPSRGSDTSMPAALSRAFALA